MSKGLTQSELKEIKERANNATTGNWNLSLGLTEGCPDEVVAGGITIAEVYDIDNALFVAHARRDVPMMVSEVERLLSRVNELESAIIEYSYPGTELYRLANGEDGVFE